MVYRNVQLFSLRQKRRSKRIEAEKKQEKSRDSRGSFLWFCKLRSLCQFSEKIRVSFIGALDEALSEHKKSKETEGRKLGFDSLTQYMDAFSSGFHNREEWDVSRLSPEQLKLELAKEAELAELERKNREAKK